MTVTNKTLRRLREHLRSYEGSTGKIYRGLLVLLHTRGSITIDDIYRQAKDTLVEEIDLNRGIGKRWDSDERDAVFSMVEHYSGRYLSPEDVDAVVLSATKSQRAQTIEDVSSMPGASFALLHQKVEEFCASREGIPQKDLLPEPTSVRVRMIRKLISDQLEYIGVARHFVSVCDLLPIMRNTIGPRGGLGKIGGKAAGVILAEKIIGEHLKTRKEEPAFEIATPETWFLRSDLFVDFVQQNDLMEYYDIKYKPIEEIKKAYPLIREVFKNGNFSTYIQQQLRELLEQIGEHPLIVRSSSLLEDNFGSAFCGKYQSIYVANQGRLEDRLQDLVGAIAEVYASTISPDPILYRSDRNLIDYDEQMGIMIQKVVGKKYGKYFLPSWAGVAFSRNEWRWTPRIKREDGLLRIVLGLGTRAVDRVGGDYPRMVPLGMPDLRPEVSADDVVRYSQKFVDVVDMEQNHFRTIPAREILGADEPPDLFRIISIRDHGMIQSPATRLINAPATSLVVTFDGLLNGPFPALMRELLQSLEDAYGWPVDMEFAYDGEKLYLLQCRPQGQRDESVEVKIPVNIPNKRKIFSASKYVQTGKVENIEYIIYIDPLDYDKLETLNSKISIGKVVGQLNHRLKGKRFILLGPGRWGSNDINLGVRVQYGDINHTLALIEMARSQGAYTPDVSFGTHFFQDLTEASIFYLPLYPDEEKNIFNEKFMRGAPNVLAALLPEAARQANTIHVIHVPGSTRGLFLHLYMTSDKDKALAFLGKEL